MKLNHRWLGALIAFTCVLEKANAYFASARTVSGTTVIAPLYLDLNKTLAPINTRIWFVADTQTNGVPTSPGSDGILGADDVLLYEDVVDGTIIGSQAGKYQRNAIEVSDQYRNAAIYVYLWNFQTPLATVPKFVPETGNTFGLYRIGIVPPPEIGNAVWNISSDVVASEFRVGGSPGNRPPIFASIPEATVTEGAILQLKLSASDPDLGQTLSFRLVSSSPTNLLLNPGSGTIEFAPTEEQGPGQISVDIEVLDSGIPPLAVTNTLKVTILEKNGSPQWNTVEEQNVVVGNPFALGLVVTDADLPKQTLELLLVTAPSGVALDPTAQRITWTPTAAQVGRQVITVQATDSGVPALNARRDIVVNVKSNSPAVLVLTATREISDSLGIRWTGKVGQRYRIESTRRIESPEWTLFLDLVGVEGVNSAQIPFNTRTGFIRLVEVSTPGN